MHLVFLYFGRSRFSDLLVLWVQFRSTSPILPFCRLTRAAYGLSVTSAPGYAFRRSRVSLPVVCSGRSAIRFTLPVLLVCGLSRVPSGRPSRIFPRFPIPAIRDLTSGLGSSGSTSGLPFTVFPVRFLAIGLNGSSAVSYVAVFWSSRIFSGPSVFVFGDFGTFVLATSFGQPHRCYPVQPVDDRGIMDRGIMAHLRVVMRVEQNLFQF